MGKILDNTKAFLDSLSEEEFKEMLDKYRIDYVDIKQDEKLLALKMIGGIELVRLYIDNSEFLDFDILKASLLTGMTIKDIENIIEQINNKNITLEMNDLNAVLSIYNLTSQRY